MTILNYARKSTGRVNDAALGTFVSILCGIEERSRLSHWDTANEHMREALLHAKSKSSNKKEFIKNTKIETGIIKDSHPIIQWCVINWY